MEDWSKIVADHGDAVWRAAYRLLGSEADAADCVQETFAAAVKVARREPVRNWPALLCRLGNTQALCILRQRLRRQKHLEAIEVPEVQDPAPGPANQALAGEAAQALRHALAGLPEQQAMAFSLRFLEDLTYEQIAEALGLSSNAVGVLIHRARTRLRQLMTASADGGKSGVPHD
jgi:RNA polymerase sigma-70 factor (ECF subfamily)